MQATNNFAETTDHVLQAAPTPITSYSSLLPWQGRALPVDAELDLYAVLLTCKGHSPPHSPTHIITLHHHPHNTITPYHHPHTHRFGGFKSSIYIRELCTNCGHHHIKLPLPKNRWLMAIQYYSGGYTVDCYTVSIHLFNPRLVQFCWHAKDIYLPTTPHTPSPYTNTLHHPHTHTF